MNAKIIRTVMVAMGILCWNLVVHAQLAPYGILNATPADDSQGLSTDSVVQLTADAQGLPLVTPDEIPLSGTFWTIVPDCNQPLPFPCLVPGQTLPTYALPDGSYLVDDSVTTNTVTQEEMELQAAMVIALIDQANEDIADTQPNVRAHDSPFPGDGGGTNIFYPDDLTNDFAVDYGTNLWIAQEAISSGTFTAIASNTVADVEYQIMAWTNLDQATNWVSQGFFLGSETTNWTPINPLPFSRTNNFFIGLRSWASSDGSGLPDWWELKYFGTTGINPNTLDSAGDGYTIFQKFEMGIPPNTWHTPLAPQGLTYTYNTNGVVTISWQPSPGSVTSYSLQKSERQLGFSTNFTLAAGTTIFPDDLPEAQIWADYTLTANYGLNGSSAPALLSIGNGGNYFPLGTRFVNGPGGRVYCVMSGLPSDLSFVRFYRQFYLPAFTEFVYGVDDGIYDLYSPLADGEFEIPASAITNGICQLPDSQVPPFLSYQFWVQTVRSNGVASDWTGLDSSPVIASTPPVDVRSQLKDNVRFLLRAADQSGPLAFEDSDSDLIQVPTNYIFAGYYGSGGTSYTPQFDPLRPICENYYYRNFVFNSSRLDGTGFLANGCFYGDSAIGYDGSSYLYVTNYPSYLFDVTNFIVSDDTVAPSSVITAGETSWIIPPSPLGEISPGMDNLYGLPYVSGEEAYVTNDELTLHTYYPGDAVIAADTAWTYACIAQPVFQTNGYYFACLNTANPLPEMNGFSPTNRTPTMIVGLGDSLTVAGYEILSVANGNNVPCYLGQAFDQAFVINTNGEITGTATGILSPYGNFFPTQPGPVALVTAPDVDPPYAQGTCTVYAVSLQLDANHDGAMDLSYNGTDATSLVNPMQFWCNNNYDRWKTHRVAFGIVYTDIEQDDQLIATCPATPNTPTPDYDYKDVYGHRVIPCTRDLEDYARLWLCGLTTNLLSALPYGSSVTLSWGDVGFPNSANPTIDLFQAADANGGIGYQTNAATAMAQTNISLCPYVGRLAPGGSIQLNSLENTLATTHFIWCGVSNGLGSLILTISDASGNVLASTAAYIQIKDIKQMYERWTVGDNPLVNPTNHATLASENLPVGASVFQYPAPANTNTPYILHVHGYNMVPWVKDRFAETEYKRLYWQGYQGRFGEFRWPTTDQGIYNLLSAFDLSESNSWSSGQGLLNLLTNLNAEYPGNVFLTAHSHGNVAAGEALHLAGSHQVVNTYLALQAAVAAHAYDPTTPNRYTPGYPDYLGDYPPNGGLSYFNGSSGAGRYVNFLNTNDWALTLPWPHNQDLKPISGYIYGIAGSSTNFYYGEEPLYTLLVLPADRYTIFADCDPAASLALGAQTNVAGSFLTGTNHNQVELDLPPYNFGSVHLYHSGEFRSDNPSRWLFWNQALIQMRLKE